MKTRADYEAAGYASGAVRLTDCPYTGWRRDAWQAGAWRRRQEMKMAQTTCPLCKKAFSQYD